MLGRRTSHSEDESPDGLSDEEQIRADERARMEDELRSLDTRDDSRGGGVADDTDRGGFARSADDDRRTDDDRITADRATTRDDTVDRDDDDDRTARDRPMTGDETVDRRADRYDEDDRVVVRQDEPIEVVRKRSFSLGQLLTLIAGGALIALGIVALVRTGLERPLNEPIEPVLGWDHTELLGIIEIVAGALLVLFSLRPGGRWIVALVGLALVVGGVLILGELDWTVEELGAEQAFGWVPIVAGAVAILASLFTPRRHQRMTGVPVVR